MTRTNTALGWVALGAVVLVLVPTRPALACSCASPDPAEVLEEARVDENRAVVIATRVDGQGGQGTLQIDRKLAGGPVPATVDGRFDRGADCDPSVPVGATAALVLERRGGSWGTTTCGQGPVSAFLHAAEGAPRAASDGAPVLILGGDFGGARLAGVDASGQPSAWGYGAGEIAGVGLCPGGEMVVEVANSDNQMALVRRSLPSLEPVGEPLNLGAAAWSAEVVCRSADAAEVTVVAAGSAEPGRIFVVTGDDVEMTREWVTGADEGGGRIFVVLAEAGGTCCSNRVGTLDVATGEVTVLAQLPGLELDRIAVSPDGSRAAVAGYDQEGPEQVAIVGDRVAGPVPSGGYVDLVWVSDDRLGLRNADDAAAEPQLEVLNLTLEVVDELAVPFGFQAKPVGDGFLVYGGVVPSFVDANGARTSVADLRLVDTRVAISLDEEPLADAVEPVSPPAAVATPLHLPWVLGGSAVVLLLAVTALRGRSRQESGRH